MRPGGYRRKAERTPGARYVGLAVGLAHEAGARHGRAGLDVAGPELVANLTDDERAAWSFLTPGAWHASYHRGWLAACVVSP